MLLETLFASYSQCQCQNFGLGLIVIEVSRTGSKEMHIHPPCSPLCALVAVLLGQNAEKLRVKELVLWSTYKHISTHTHTHIYIYNSTVPVQAMANSTELVLQFQKIIISSSWPQCYSSQPFAK